MTRPFNGAEAYTLAGGLLPTRYVGGGINVDLAKAPVAPGGAATIIIKFINVKGIFSRTGADEFVLKEPAGQSVVSLVEFRLPRTVRVKTVTPEPVEDGKASGGRVFVMAMERDSTELLGVK